MNKLRSVIFPQTYDSIMSIWDIRSLGFRGAPHRASLGHEISLPKEKTKSLPIFTPIPLVLYYLRFFVVTEGEEGG
uniref:Uncharacterized protein n=1 Tax=Metallosphaera hakonensis JCM 8857 = DSM 7519 TaxID=1293036 RepID=A0A2U9IT04_9CREN